MGLGNEYFIDQTHITELQKLKDQELYFIIYLFKDELEYFDQFDGFKLEGLIKAYNNMKDLIKDFRFILNGYVKLMTENNNNIPLESLTAIKGLWSDINNIEDCLNKTLTVRLSKEKVNDLVDTCILYMRLFYESLGNFLFMENRFWITHSSTE